VSTFIDLTGCLEGRLNMPRPCKLTFDLLTLTLVSESRVTWATSVPILVFLSLSVLDLVPMNPTNVRQTDRQMPDAHHYLMPPPYWGIIINTRNSAIADKPRDAFSGQTRSPNMVQFDMLGMVSY